MIRNPGIFDVSQGVCGHIWRKGAHVLDGCPVCFDNANKIRSTLTDLRAQVAALLEKAEEQEWETHGDHEYMGMVVAYGAVLDLFDGTSNPT